MNVIWWVQLVLYFGMRLDVSHIVPLPPLAQNKT